MVPEDKLDKFVGLLRDAAGPNLESVVLYGSAAGGDFHPEFSNLNVFCLLRDVSYRSLLKLHPAVRWWDRQKQPALLFMTRAELQRSTDVFTIELMDMKAHHRVLFGADPLEDLPVPLALHRLQVEYELREKLVVLRQALSLVADNDKQLWQVLLKSLSSFLTLFRHALIALGETAPEDKRQAVKILSTRLGFTPDSVFHLLDIREHKAIPKDFQVTDLVGEYLAAVEQVVASVDRMLDSAGK